MRAACLGILAATNVGLAPGVFFGPGSETFLRACVCRAPEVLIEAIGRLEKVLGASFPGWRFEYVAHLPYFLK